MGMVSDRVPICQHSMFNSHRRHGHRILRQTWSRAVRCGNVVNWLLSSSSKRVKTSARKERWLGSDAMMKTTSQINRREATQSTERDHPVDLNKQYGPPIHFRGTNAEQYHPQWPCALSLPLTFSLSFIPSSDTTGRRIFDNQRTKHHPASRGTHPNLPEP